MVEKAQLTLPSNLLKVHHLPLHLNPPLPRHVLRNPAQHRPIPPQHEPEVINLDFLPPTIACAGRGGVAGLDYEIREDLVEGTEGCGKGGGGVAEGEEELAEVGIGEEGGVFGAWARTGFGHVLQTCER